MLVSSPLTSTSIPVQSKERPNTSTQPKLIITSVTRDYFLRTLFKQKREKTSTRVMLDTDE